MVCVRQYIEFLWKAHWPGKLYLCVKCGRRWKQGSKTNAGKVMRLKIPNVRSNPRIAEERSEDRCCGLLATACHVNQQITYSVIQYSLNHDQAP